MYNEYKHIENIKPKMKRGDKIRKRSFIDF